MSHSPASGDPGHGQSKKRVLLLGATGTIGRAAVGALRRRGHDVVCIVRPQTTDPAAGPRGPAARGQGPTPPVEGLDPDQVRACDVTDPTSLAAAGFRGERFDAVMSCLASRSGMPEDAWAIDHDAHVTALDLAKDHGVASFVLLSAICVQRPKLPFQFAKLAFEEKLTASGLTYAIVRPTAFFKSLSGQIDRLRAGKPYLLFGDGTLTACKPISDNDLANYLVDCLERPALQNKILPIGGPGPAVTPRQQGEHLFHLLNRPPKYRKMPVAVMDAIIGVLSVLGWVSAKASRAAALARIGRYYATESMLLYNAGKGRYDAAATPTYGTETLFDHYRAVIRGNAANERVETAVF